MTPATERTLRVVAIVLAAIGLAGSVVAFLPYVDGPDVCGAVGGSCAALITTSYSTVFGLPAPIVAAMYFAALLAMLVGELLPFEDQWRGDGSGRPRLGAVPINAGRWRVLLVLSTGGAAMSLWLGIVSTAVVQTLCWSCLVVHGANLGLTGVIVYASWRDDTSWLLRRMVPALIMTLAIGASGAATWYMLRSPLPMLSQPGARIAHPVMSWSARGRSATLIIDPGCANCAMQWRELASTYDLRVGLRPLDEPCVELALAIDPELKLPGPESYHLGACRLAAWVYCADQQDKAAALLAVAFRAMNEQGAHTVSRWDGVRYLELGEAAGLDREAQLTCTGESEKPWTPDAMLPRTRRAFARHLATTARTIGLRGVPLLIK